MSKVRLGIEDTNQAHEDPSLQAVELLVGKPLALRGMYVRYVPYHTQSYTGGTPGGNRGCAGIPSRCVLFSLSKIAASFAVYNKAYTLLSSVIQSNQSSIEPT